MEGDKTSPLETSGLREKEPVPASVRLRNKRLAAANTAGFIAVLAFNGLAGSGKLTGTSIGEVSRLYPTYITPESFAFSIWGVIYTCMSLLVLFGLTSPNRLFSCPISFPPIFQQHRGRISSNPF